MVLECEPCRQQPMLQCQKGRQAYDSTQGRSFSALQSDLNYRGSSSTSGRPSSQCSLTSSKRKRCPTPPPLQSHPGSYFTKHKYKSNLYWRWGSLTQNILRPRNELILCVYQKISTSWLWWCLSYQHLRGKTGGDRISRPAWGTKWDTVFKKEKSNLL